MGAADAVVLACKVCGAEFPLPERERLRHAHRGDKMPTKCRPCRRQAGLAKERPEPGVVVRSEMGRFIFVNLDSGGCAYAGWDVLAQALGVGERVLVVLDPRPPSKPELKRRAFAVKPEPKPEEATR